MHRGGGVSFKIPRSHGAPECVVSLTDGASTNIFPPIYLVDAVGYEKVKQEVHHCDGRTAAKGESFFVLITHLTLSLP